MTSSTRSAEPFNRNSAQLQDNDAVSTRPAVPGSGNNLSGPAGAVHLPDSDPSGPTRSRQAADCDTLWPTLRSSGLLVAPDPDPADVLILHAQVVIREAVRAQMLTKLRRGKALKKAHLERRLWAEQRNSPYEPVARGRGRT
ncbi:MAG: hypothetical protein ACTHQ3_01365 [Motilibacteraceae bacterium]